MEDFITTSQDLLAAYGFKIIAALAILILGRWAAMAIRRLAVRMMTKAKV